MTAEDRLVEIRDLLAQLVQASRDAAKRQDEHRDAFRAAMAAQRRWQRMGLAIMIPLIGLLLYLVFR